MWTMYDSVPGICRYDSTDAQLRFGKPKLFSLRWSAAATKKTNRIFCELLLPRVCARVEGNAKSQRLANHDLFLFYLNSSVYLWVADDTPIRRATVHFQGFHFQKDIVNFRRKREENSTTKAHHRR